MAEKTIKDLLQRFQVMESEEQAKAPGARAENGPIKNLGGNLNMDKLKVSGTDADITVSSKKDELGGLASLSPSKSNPLPDKAHALELATATELLEAGFGEEEPEEDEESEGDFGGAAESDLEGAGAGEPEGELPAEGEDVDGAEDLGQDDSVESTLAHIEDLLRDAFDNPDLSVQIGVNAPGGGDELDDPAVPAEGEEGGEEEQLTPPDDSALGVDDDYGEDQETMESFLADSDDESKKKSDNDEEDDENKDDNNDNIYM